MDAPTTAQLEEMLDDLRWSGQPESEIAAARREAELIWNKTDQALRIHPANEAAVRLFLMLATQWRTTSLNTMQRALLIKTGLEYGAIERTAALAGLGEVTADTFTRLRLLEAEALDAFREERERLS